MQPKILIVEYHPLYRDALAQLMRQVVANNEVIAANSAEDALTQLARYPKVQIILLDLGLPGLNPGAVIGAFKKINPSILIVAISASENHQQMEVILETGVSMAVSKAVASEVMIGTVKSLLSGLMQKPKWITPADKIIYSSTQCRIPNLTDRQRETLELLSCGHSNKAIALQLGVAEITAKVHVSAVFKVLGVVNRTQAVTLAHNLGLLNH